MVVNMRKADESGDLNGFVNLLLASCDPQRSETQELRFLLECHTAWVRAIAKAIGTDRPLGEIRGEPIVLPETGRRPNITDTPSVLPSPASSEGPPEPGPIRDFNDPQKGRWGGVTVREGRKASVVIESVEREVFYFSVVVESTDLTPLVGPVIFHLHDSFPRSVVTIKKIENQQAVLREWNAYGVFAVGIQVKNGAGEWTSLEIDLADAPGLPKRFLSR